jgi:hydroxymethylglutaryl-CoA lyase
MGMANILAALETGVDLESLLECVRALPVLVHHDVPGQLVKSGTSARRYPVPALPAGKR